MRGHGRGRGRGRGRRRVTRMLEPALLLLLGRGPAHGYTLLEQLADFGLEDLNPGVVYRVLRDMESWGWVTSIWDEEESQGPPRRVYQIAPEGDQALRMWITDLEGIKGRIDQLLVAYTQHTDQD